MCSFTSILCIISTNKIHCIAQQSTFYVAIGFATMIMKATANICTKQWRHIMQGIAALRAQTSSAGEKMAAFFNIPALVQIIAWRRSGDKPLSEPMMVSLVTHICVTRPQWVNTDGGEISMYAIHYLNPWRSWCESIACKILKIPSSE